MGSPHPNLNGYQQCTPGGACSAKGLGTFAQRAEGCSLGWGVLKINYSLLRCQINGAKGARGWGRRTSGSIGTSGSRAGGVPNGSTSVTSRSSMTIAPEASSEFRGGLLFTGSRAGSKATTRVVARPGAGRASGRVVQSGPDNREDEKADAPHPIHRDGGGGGKGVPVRMGQQRNAATGGGRGAPWG